MKKFFSKSYLETENIAEKFAENLKGGEVIAMFGSLGMGKTAFVRGLAKGYGLDSEVSSPTFSLVNDYGGNPPLVHFDMYRVNSWDDLYSTGFFDYIDLGCTIVIEWSENIENALSDDCIRIEISPGENENDRIITIFDKTEVK